MDMQFSESDWYEIENSTVYMYDGKKVKTHGHIFMVSIVFILAVMAILITLTVSGEIKRTHMSMLFFLSFIIMIAYIVKNLQFDAMKALTQYYVDTDRNCYKVQFTAVCMKLLRVRRHFSYIPLVAEMKTFLDAMEKLKIKESYMEEAYQDAQTKALGYYYVKRFKQGIRDWNPLYGGEAKVACLGNIDSIKIPKNFCIKVG